MSEIAVYVGVVVLFMVLIFVMALVGTAIGAFVGWVVSLTPLGKLVVSGLMIFGFDASGKLVALGAALGFVTGFIKGVVSIKKEDS